MLIALIFLSLPPLLFILSGISDGMGRQVQAARLRRWAWISFVGLPAAFFVSRNAIDHIYRAMACEQVVLAEARDDANGLEISAWSETCRRGETPTYHVAVRFGGWLFGQWQEVVTSEIDPVPVAVAIIGISGDGARAEFSVGLAGAVGSPPSRTISLGYVFTSGTWDEHFFYRRGFRVEGVE
ncbi:MAG TPA: hypothetical protein PLA85_03735 [Micropepsaceae bacterium]|nr:hypothetical protein [Micropepsaceae bacterium]